MIPLGSKPESASLLDHSVLEYQFALYREQHSDAAICAVMARRAAGTAAYAPTTMHLIDCSKQFEEYYRTYLTGFGVTVRTCRRVSPDVREFGPEHDSIVITHSWPATLYGVSKMLKGKFKLAVIEQIPPLYDRFKSEVNPSPTAWDKLLTWKPVRNLLTARYRSAVREATIYIANSPREAEVLERYYGLKVNFVSPDPYDSACFSFNPRAKRSRLVVFAPSGSPRFSSDQVQLLRGVCHARDLALMGNFGEDGTKIARGAFNSVEIHAHYDHPTLAKVLSEALLAFVPERKGSFENVPIECLASGVPVVGPLVPSLAMAEESFSRVDKHFRPFLTPPELLVGASHRISATPAHNWYDQANERRSDFAAVIKENFSMPMVQGEFVRLITSWI
jgi:glycosyltransferase involved in cell wall biosynthesis